MAGDDAPVVVDAGTKLSAVNAAQLRAAVSGALDRRGTTIHLLLGAVTSYDAAGLGLLVGLRHRIDAADGHLVCVNPSPPVYSALRRLGLHRVLDIRLDVPEQPSSRSAMAPAAREAGRASGR